MKNGKEFKNNSFANYSIAYGTVNNKQPKSIYINLSAWAEPINKYETNYSKIIKDLNKNLNKYLYTYVTTNNNFFNQIVIIDLDLRESGINYNKRSFMNCEITLFQNEESLKPITLLKNHITELSNKIATDIFNNSPHFKFHKKK